MGIEDPKIPCVITPSIRLPVRGHLSKCLYVKFYLHIIKMSIKMIITKHRYVLAAHFDFTVFLYCNYYL